jgi:hypothetical protein
MSERGPVCDLAIWQGAGKKAPASPQHNLMLVAWFCC